ncbi:KAP family P-loop NTPase fold protein [Xanthomonas arboricola]|uniref:KAP family P-loop NTPase fold protein n=1 Tax=Xanthomonas arboricola TaxID=56448 RepID=UPI000F8EEC70|nr:P-loop NTPase fold protein [Xanthomonas arboricola]
MWSDIETRRDYLNYLELAEVVSEILLNPSMRPVSVGVFGTWGTGKSSLLNLIEVKLRESAKDEVIVIRFDAWLYQGYDDARAALMDVIARTLYEAAKEDAGLRGTATRMLDRVDKVRVLGVGVELAAAAFGIPLFGVASRAMGALGDAVAGKADEEDGKALVESGKQVAKVVRPAKEQSPPEQIDAFREEFALVLEGLKKPMVVFVDNLDRCLPAQTIHTLEALRLFLFMKQSAFVVAADEDMVRNSVSQHFNGAGARHVTDYLDKLIQIPVRVPRLGITEIRAYLFMLFADAGNVSEANRSALQAGLEDNLRKSWETDPLTVEEVLAYCENPSDALRSSFETADRLAPLLVNSKHVLGNPRLIKRLLNTVRLRVAIAARRKMPVNEAMVAKFALFERCADEQAINQLYSLITSAPKGTVPLMAELEALSKDREKFVAKAPKEWEKSVAFIFDWFGLEPKLGKLDLRSLVYLSRETAVLRTSSSGLSAVAVSALAGLREAKTLSSPMGLGAVRTLPPGERSDVMRELIGQMRGHADWKKKPDGFVGAKLLADADSSAAGQLAVFIRSLPSPLPGWLTVSVKDADWFKEEA